MTRPALWTQLPGARVTAKKPRRRLRAVSRGRAAELRLYRQEAAAFVAAAVKRGETCPVVNMIQTNASKPWMRYGQPVSTRIVEVHHRYGRAGKLLRWQPGWSAMSKQGHRFVHQHPEWAQQHGFIGPVGTWNDFERAKDYVSRTETKL